MARSTHILVMARACGLLSGASGNTAALPAVAGRELRPMPAEWAQTGPASIFREAGSPAFFEIGMNKYSGYQQICATARAWPSCRILLRLLQSAAFHQARDQQKRLQLRRITHNFRYFIVRKLFAVGFSPARERYGCGLVWG